MRRHVQAVGDEGDGAEQEAADDFHRHHDPAQGNDAPGPTLVALVALAEEDM